MTLLTTTDRVQYPGNGVALAFPYAFRIFVPTDLVVTLTEDATGSSTTQVLNSDYFVNILSNETGGTVSMVAPPATGYTLTLQRVLTLTQQLDITNQGHIYPDALEKAYDRIYAILQSLSVDAGNALKLSADGTVWDGEGLRLTNILDAAGTQDAVTLGQLEQVVQNLAAGQAAFAPLTWQYTSAGAFVYSLPGASITRPDAYTVSWDGVIQSPNSYVIGVSSNPFVITFDSIPPTGVTILIRAIGFAETLSSANIDASGVVSGVFDAARLGAGTASDAVFLSGGPGQPTWTNELNGPLVVNGTITFSGLDGVADTSLITTGVFPPQRLGTGTFGVNTVLHGDGVFRIPAVATTTGFGLSDAVNAPAVFTSLIFTGDVAESADTDSTVPKVKIFIKDDGGGSGAGTLEGYVDTLLAEGFGTVEACSVMTNFVNFPDTPTWFPATTNNRVFSRISNQLGFNKVNMATLDTTGTPDGTKFLRDDGAWSAVTASLGTSVATDPVGSTPTYPGTGIFYRGDSQWSNTIVGTYYVMGAAGTPPILQIGTNLTQVTFGAIRNSLEIPLTFNSWQEISAVGGALLTSNDASDRLAVNGRIRGTRMRGEGSGMVRMQSTATSGAITLDHNVYGHFVTTPSGNVTYTFSDGGTDPTAGSYASEFTLEVVNPGANTFTWPVDTVWAGGITPTMAAVGRNFFRFMKRMGVTGYLGTLINSDTAGFTTEDAQDAVGTILTASSSIVPTYADATPSISFAIAAGGVDAGAIASNAVETSKIAAGAVTNAKVAAGTLTVDRLAATGTRDALHVLSGGNTWVPLSSGGGQASIQFKDEGVNIGSSGAITDVNFLGSGVTASVAGTTLNVSVSGGGSAINWADDGFVVANSTTHPTLSFGTDLSLVDIGGGVIRVNSTASGGGGGGGGGQAAIQFRDEGSAVGSSGTITTFNVVGAGASLSVAGTTATLTVPGGGGGGGATGIVYNVRDYGATGNGSSDDTSSIQAAITAAAGAGGGIVALPAGTYIVAAGLTVPSKVSVVGSGMGATVIKLKNSAAGTSDILRGLGNYVNFSDFTVDGNASNNPTNLRSGVSFADGSAFCRATNVYVLNNRGFGWAFNACTDMTFDNCWAVGTKKRQGFWMGSLTTRSARITYLNCKAIQSDWDGIHVHGDQVEIIGGYWNENGQDVTDIGTFGACGVYVDGAFPCEDLVITNAVANDNKESGFGLASGAGTVISNCVARRNWAGGFVVGGSRGMVSNCYAEGNGAVWLTATPFYGSLGPPPYSTHRFIYSGICSLSATEMVFTGNRCHDLKSTKSQKWGIAAETAATGVNTNYLRLTGNMLHGNLTADTGVETATNVTVV